MGEPRRIPTNELSCSALQVDLAYVKQHTGSYEAALRGVAHPESFLLDEDNWVDYQTLLQVYRNIRDAFTDDPDVMRKIGQTVIESNVYATVRLISFLIYDPVLIYKKVPTFAEKTFRFVRARFESTDRQRARIVYSFDASCAPSSAFAEHVQGMFEKIPCVAGYREAEVTYEIIGQDIVFDVAWTKQKTQRTAYFRRLNMYSAAVEKLEVSKGLLEEKNEELESANRRIRDQLRRQIRLHDLGLMLARVLAEQKLEESLLRFFDHSLGLRDALYAVSDERGRFQTRWWLRDGKVVLDGATPNADRGLPRALQRFLASAAQVRYEPRSLDLFIEAPGFYPAAAGFTVLPLLADDRHHACLVLPQSSTAAAENADEMQFLHSVRTEVELALARVVAVDELDQLKRNLEKVVEQRTGELGRANADLANANADMERANAELGRANQEIQKQIRQLRVLDRVKTDFLLNVSFELRNPLNMILSPLQVLLDPRRETDPETRDLLETIRKNTLTLLKHITHLLELQRRDNYNVFLNYGVVKPRELLERILGIASEHGQRVGIDLRLTVEDDLPDIVVDVERISSALHAIVSNALKFNRPGGSVEIRAAREDEWLRVDVRDTGIGIDDEQQTRMFERFQSQGDPMRKEYPGIGIGLSVASDHVQLHKGRITVKSRKGQGATFSVYLPLGDAHVEEAFRERRRRTTDGAPPQGRRSADQDKNSLAQYVAEQPTLEYVDIVDLQRSRDRRQARYSLVSRKTVLFAHADVRFLEVAEAILLEFVNVRTARDGEEAWEVLTKEQPDLLIAAPALPRRTGLELVRDLRATAAVRKTPVILLSEKIDLESSLQGLDEGADMYMSVPVDFNALVAHIRQLIENRELRAALEADKTSLEDKVARLAEEREKLSMGVIEAMALAIDAKDRYTHGHSARVREFATDFARHLGLDQHAIKRLEFSSILHDIGKIGIPEEILNKRERLSDDEWKIVRSHPMKGVEILGALPGFPDALKEIRGHHERWDGRGYPDGLKGDNIPEGARLLALADSYDAMSFGRVYRDARSPEDIAREISRCAGSQFDPVMAKSFLEFLEQRPS
jgi:putative two-component system response regulator